MMTFSCMWITNVRWQDNISRPHLTNGIHFDSIYIYFMQSVIVHSVFFFWGFSTDFPATFLTLVFVMKHNINYLPLGQTIPSRPCVYSPSRLPSYMFHLLELLLNLTKTWISNNHEAYQIIVADAADAVSVNFSGRCKFFFRFNAKIWQFTVYFAVITQKNGIYCVFCRNLRVFSV